MSPFCLLQNWMLIVPHLGPEWRVHASAASGWEEAGTSVDGQATQAGHSGLVVPLPRPWRELRGLKGWDLPQASTSQGLPSSGGHVCYLTWLGITVTQLLTVCGSRSNQTAPSSVFTFTGSCQPSALQSPQTPFPCSVPSVALVSSVLGGSAVPWHCSATALVAEDSGEVRGQHPQLRMAPSAV